MTIESENSRYGSEAAASFLRKSEGTGQLSVSSAVRQDLSEGYPQSNYFCVGPVSSAYCVVDQHTQYRLRQWLRANIKDDLAQA